MLHLTLIFFTSKLRFSAFLHWNWQFSSFILYIPLQVMYIGRYIIFCYNIKKKRKENTKFLMRYSSGGRFIKTHIVSEMNWMYLLLRRFEIANKYTWQFQLQFIAPFRTYFRNSNGIKFHLNISIGEISSNEMSTCAIFRIQ